MKIEENKDFDIIAKIKEVAESECKTDAEFAKRWGKSPQNVYDLYKRKSIDVKTLLEISKVLSYNFFEDLQQQLPFYKKKDDVKEPIKATLQIELSQDKKDQVLRIVFGDNNLKILNE
ncbi:hypothetical protein [Capnocytophaga catalasegens]|uniref:HTH cro/C1-type domain-containing protein n=1 Tax=Capnocytophaga catalasegens TaxID=1004260 RepID=A0AAV5AS80_9FLAO|nr:hypothetical protein [Capnocytophaga catalasegens]GIZ15049.1 hypothetical protein RCZ03_10490 [Capnocytophaga catalasegens]GJM49429.1 hypothetical protein RCZ15_04040 [Capnocytophaga catalasegens]GJM52579.1 hypothetical protein RCZ16_08960 [Capnocytophaga catalasegens]